VFGRPSIINWSNGILIARVDPTCALYKIEPSSLAKPNDSSRTSNPALGAVIAICVFLPPWPAFSKVVEPVTETQSRILITTGRARTEFLRPVAPATTESEGHPSFDLFASVQRVSVLVAGQKTTLPRTTDTHDLAHNRQVARKKRARLAGLIRLRASEDMNFVYKTVRLARRMAEWNRFLRPPERVAVVTGEEFLQALVAASRRGRIANLVVFGHAASTALYMREDLGFYDSITAVAKSAPFVTGTDGTKESVLRNLGARDLGDLETLIKNGVIRFTSDAIVVFAGCGVAGTNNIEKAGIAARFAEITGATVIASVGVTDQSMAGRRGSIWKYEFSRGTWVQFVRGAPPRTLRTKLIDVLDYLRSERFETKITTSPALERPPQLLPASNMFQCAVEADNMDSANPCGLGEGDNATSAFDRGADDDDDE
jgi:hypothetical protein